MSNSSSRGTPAFHVTVIIPVKNEARKIRACIESILSQTVSVTEIIVVDSGSTDGTLNILEDFPDVRVIPMNAEAFNHGEARNIGAKAAVTEWVVLTVGDARAADNLWIERLFAGVLDDGVAGVCGAQIVPHTHDANPLEWFQPVSDPVMRRFQFSSAQEFDELTPAQKKEACSWDDVTALYRRNVLLRVPFEPVMYGEDAIWAKSALRLGHALVYNPAATVHHYHNETAEFTFRRTAITLCLRYLAFGFVHERPSISRTMSRVFRRLASERDLSLMTRLQWLRYNWRNQLAARSAYRDFSSALARGQFAVDGYCKSSSTRPPVPSKSVPTN